MIMTLTYFGIGLFVTVAIVLAIYWSGDIED
jgi:hypothetical protein